MSDEEWKSLKLIVQEQCGNTLVDIKFNTAVYKASPTMLKYLTAAARLKNAVFRLIYRSADNTEFEIMTLP
jgi:type VI protein secretion system component Hcp